MKIVLATLMALLTLTLFGPSRSQAATFNPQNSMDLQDDLMDAATNEEDDVINLEPNTVYNVKDTVGMMPFEYIANVVPDENFSLTINGAEDGSSEINGDGSFACMQISTTGGLADDSDADILISHVTFSRCIVVYQIATIKADIHLDNIEVNQSGSTATLQSSEGDVTINPSLFQNNTALMHSILANLGDININNSIFMDNEITNFIFQSGLGNVFMDGNLIKDNSIISSAFFIVQSSTNEFRFTNNIVKDNKTLSAGVAGPLVFILSDGILNMINNTIVFNRSVGGAANAFAGALVQTVADSTIANIFNNIFFGNVILNTSITPTATDLVVVDDLGGNNIGSEINIHNNDINEFLSICEENNPPCTPNVDPQANINADPLFINSDIWDLNLGNGSPAIGAGDPNAPGLPATDFDGNPLNNPPDLGALAAQVVLEIDPANIDFGQVSTDVPSSRTVTLNNTGGIPLQVSDISVDDTNNFGVGFGSCGAASFTLPGGDTCTIEITFDPSSAGSFTATVTITSNDPDNPTRVISLSGIGVGGGGCSLGAATTPGFFALFLLLIPGMWMVRKNSSHA